MFRNIFKQVQEQRGRGKLIKQLVNENKINNVREELARLEKKEDTFNRQALIVVFSGATAAIHIYLGGTLFLLNGAGFLAGLAAHYAVPQRESYQKWTRDVLLGYTGFTVVGYFVLKGVGGWGSPIGIASKLVELGLMRVLWADREAAEEQVVVLVENAQDDLGIHAKTLSEGFVTA